MLVILISRCQRGFAPHAFGPQSKHLGDHLFKIVNALGSKSTFPEVGVIWLLAHAFRSRSKRLGADLFSDIVNALCWYRDYQISARFGSRLTPAGSEVSAQVLFVQKLWMSYAGIAIFGFRQDLAPGSRLSAPK